MEEPVPAPAQWMMSVTLPISCRNVGHVKYLSHLSPAASRHPHSGVATVFKTKSCVSFTPESVKESFLPSPAAPDGRTPPPLV